MGLVLRSTNRTSVYPLICYRAWLGLKVTLLPCLGQSQMRSLVRQTPSIVGYAYESYKILAFVIMRRQQHTHLRYLVPESTPSRRTVPLEQHIGFEPMILAWKANVLPLHQCCISYVEFERATLKQQRLLT